MGMTRAMRRRSQREAFNRLCKVTVPKPPPQPKPWYLRLLEWLLAKLKAYNK